MLVSFKKKALAKKCNSEKEAIKEWGPQRGRAILKRIQELKAAPTLADMFSLTQAYCHPLTQDRSGQFAVKTVHPYRLVFTPDHDPLPLKNDGGIDLSRVKEIIILEVVDYHGK